MKHPALTPDDVKDLRKISDDDYFLQMSSGLVHYYKHRLENPGTSKKRKKMNREIQALHTALKGLGVEAQGLVSIRYFAAEADSAYPPDPIELHIDWMLEASDVKFRAGESLRKRLARDAAIQFLRLGLPVDPGTGSDFQKYLDVLCHATGLEEYPTPDWLNRMAKTAIKQRDKKPTA